MNGLKERKNGPTKWCRDFFPGAWQIVGDKRLEYSGTGWVLYEQYHISTHYASQKVATVQLETLLSSVLRDSL